jgi:tungstate transport system substrate-binding protein
MTTIGLGRSLLLTAAILLAGAGAAQSAQPLRLATTTSTENSGLLGYLLPAFEKHSGMPVHVIAVGTGKALRIARAGDVDVVMVHARPAEQRFVAEGHGVHRREFMYNDFVVVGPGDDPAGIASTDSVAKALHRIAASGSRFVSRGDDSGTHKKELALWEMAGVKPATDWYVESGLGMGKVLQMASELDAYTLTDRGTWLAYRGHLELALLLQGDPPLFNPYGVIAVNPQRHPHVNYAGATALIDWLASTQGQEMIARYSVDGQVLFHPLLLPRD